MNEHGETLENHTATRLNELFAEPFEHLILSSPVEGCVELKLNRPELRNAFNEELIAELTRVLQVLQGRLSETELRVLLLSGAGKSFCAGADLDMMRRQGRASYESNCEDSRRLAQLFRVLSEAPFLVVAVAQGAAIGGGFGLCVCADVVLTHARAVFATTEVRLGLIPAVISPYIVRKLGVGAASFPLLHGHRLEASQAQALGLVHAICEEAEQLPELTRSTVEGFLSCGPSALRQTKELLVRAAPLPQEKVVQNTVQAIARTRQSPEAQAGLASFFDRQPTPWSRSVSAAEWGEET